MDSKKNSAAESWPPKAVTAEHCSRQILTLLLLGGDSNMIGNKNTLTPPGIGSCPELS